LQAQKPYNGLALNRRRKHRLKNVKVTNNFQQANSPLCPAFPLRRLLCCFHFK